jgi:hypothetical protein
MQFTEIFTYGQVIRKKQGMLALVAYMFWHTAFISLFLLLNDFSVLRSGL